MNLTHSLIILAAAFLAVFLESAFGGVRSVLGAQVSLLPPIMVYASLTSGLATVTLLAVLGGLWFDSLSANPLGVTPLPLFLIGWVIYQQRELILRDQAFARFILGLCASVLAPALTVGLILTTGGEPLLGWGSLWQWLVMGLGGGLLTPVCFVVFNRLGGAICYRPAFETSFKPDREIIRGRS